MPSFVQGFKDGLNSKPRAIPTVPKTPVVNLQPTKSVTDEIRAGNTQAEHNKNSHTLFVSQLLILSALAGANSNSWLVGGAVFLILGILFYVPFIGKLIGFGMAIACGFGIYKLGLELDAPEAGGVIGVIVSLSFIAANLASRQYIEDINKK
jgi:hypothetical protein